MGARLKQHYLKQTVPALTKEFSYTNPMAVPKIQKISVNIGLGEATQNQKLMDGCRRRARGRALSADPRRCAW